MTEITKFTSGKVGSGRGIGTTICQFRVLEGKWKVWGTVRHSKTDGCRLVLGTDKSFVIPSNSNSTETFGPITIQNSEVMIVLEVATGRTDGAAAMLFADKVAENGAP